MQKRMVMNKIKVSLDDIPKKIKTFYDKTAHSFLTLNAVAIDENCIEVQWIFSSYKEKNDVTIFYALVNPDDTIPSITSIIPSAIISQRELVDMFGLNVQESEKGLYLDEDSIQAPLSAGCQI